MTLNNRQTGGYPLDGEAKSEQRNYRNVAQALHNKKNECRAFSALLFSTRPAPERRLESLWTGWNAILVALRGGFNRMRSTQFCSLTVLRQCLVSERPNTINTKKQSYPPSTFVSPSTHGTFRADAVPCISVFKHPLTLPAQTSNANTPGGFPQSFAICINTDRCPDPFCFRSASSVDCCHRLLVVPILVSYVTARHDIGAAKRTAQVHARVIHVRLASNDFAKRGREEQWNSQSSKHHSRRRGQEKVGVWIRTSISRCC